MTISLYLPSPRPLSLLSPRKTNTPPHLPPRNQIILHPSSPHRTLVRPRPRHPTTNRASRASTTNLSSHPRHPHSIATPATPLSVNPPFPPPSSTYSPRGLLAPNPRPCVKKTTQTQIVISIQSYAAPLPRLSTNLTPPAHKGSPQSIQSAHPYAQSGVPYPPLSPTTCPLLPLLPLPTTPSPSPPPGLGLRPCAIGTSTLPPCLAHPLLSYFLPPWRGIC